MRATNPAVVPRRWLLEAASSAAEAGEYPEVNRLLGLLTHPYEEPTGGAEAQPPRARTSVVSGGEVPPVDAARLGVAGPRAVQALEDATFWQRLCPELTVLYLLWLHLLWLYLLERLCLELTVLQTIYNSQAGCTGSQPPPTLPYDCRCSRPPPPRWHSAPRPLA